MHQFQHEHIVELLGVCFHSDQQPQYLVLELMEQGDLQNFLRRARPTIEHDQCQLSYENCLDIARQIAEGAYYLEQHAYVHRYEVFDVVVPLTNAFLRQRFGRTKLSRVSLANDARTNRRQDRRFRSGKNAQPAGLLPENG